MSTSKITMKTLTRQKAEIRAKIARQHSELAQIYWDAMAPFYRMGYSPLSLLKNFSVSVALFEGVIASLRLIRKIRGLFRK